MRYPLSLGPFYPGWPGVLRLRLEVEGAAVWSAEAAMLQAEGPRPEDWAGLSPEEGLDGVERLAAFSSWAYTLAYCQALESLAGLEVPPRARSLRVALAEVERCLAHLVTTARLLWAAGRPVEAGHFYDLGEQVLRARAHLTGRRFFSGLNRPGGLAHDLPDLSPLADLVAQVRGPLYRLSDRLIADRTLAAMLVGAGPVTREQAEEEGLAGPSARAAAIERDLRLERPYAAYEDLPPRVVRQEGGDAFARWLVRLLETMESLNLLERVVQEAPPGAVCSAEGGEFPEGEAQSRVEAPAGPLSVRLQVRAMNGGATRLAGLWRGSAGRAHLAALPRLLVGQPLDQVGVVVASWGFLEEVGG